jgi:hypothetical protein
MPGAVAQAAGQAAAVHDVPMQETSRRRSATPRGRALSPAVGTGGSPLAKRSRQRITAEVPPAPNREMTIQEGTHSLQHLMAQATHDTAWITTTQTLLEDHAKLIDEGSAKAQILNQVGIAMKAEINRAFATVGENDIKIKSVIKDLCAVTQQSVASLDTSFREQVKAEIIDLRTAIDRVGSGGGSVPPNVQLMFKVNQIEANS